MNIPENLKYTDKHEWILIEGTAGTIGITDFAQGELGDIVYANFDLDLTEVAIGGVFGTLEAVKTLGELYSPCSGKIVEFNSGIESAPESVNIDPYGKGWLLKIELTNLSEVSELLDAVAYAKLVGA